MTERGTVYQLTSEKVPIGSWCIVRVSQDMRAGETYTGDLEVLLECDNIAGDLLGMGMIETLVNRYGENIGILFNPADEIEISGQGKEHER